MGWLSFAALAAVSFGFYNFFTKLSADKMSPVIALLFITGSAFLVALVGLLVMKVSGQELIFSKQKILWPILAGVSTGFAEIFYLFMFANKAPLAIANPIVVGGTIIVAVILGTLLLKEHINWVQATGLLFTLIGIIILTKG